MQGTRPRRFRTKNFLDRRNCVLGGRGVYPKGVGRESFHILKVGVDGLVILDFDILLLVVALSIPVMPIVNGDYLKLVLLYVYVNSTELSILEILTTTLEYPNHAGPKSKIMLPCSTQTR